MVERTPRLQVAFVSERLEREALDWFLRCDERAYSFVDATSFALMRSLGLQEALAFDGDFAAAGFVELRAAQGRSPRLEPRATRAPLFTLL